MKLRILKPGKTGPEFSFPVVYETDHSIFVQIEYEGKSYTFDLLQQDNGLTIQASGSLLMVLPMSGNTIAIQGPEDRPGKYKD